MQTSPRLTPQFFQKKGNLLVSPFSPHCKPREIQPVPLLNCWEKRLKMASLINLIDLFHSVNLSSNGKHNQFHLFCGILVRRYV